MAEAQIATSFNRSRRSSLGSKKKVNMFKVLTHSSLFGIQSIIFTMPNAIYFQIFTTIGILDETQSEQVPKIVGYLTLAFFIGKLISDPLWGVVRDKIGDKKSFTIITIFCFVSMVIVGFMTNITQLAISLGLIGLASGIYVPGTAFINWIDPQNRDYLAMWIYIFAGGGALIGPFVGSTLMDLMPEPKILWTWGSVGLVMLFLTGVFLFAFRDFDDAALIQESNYSKIDDLEGQDGDGVAYLDSFHQSGRNEPKENILMKAASMTSSDKKLAPPIEEAKSMLSSGRKKKENKRVHFEAAIMEKEKEQEAVVLSEMELMRSRKRVSKMTAGEVMWRDSARRNMVIINGIAWSVKFIDWMLFAIWVETEKEKGGLGFSSFETGAISLLCFPCVSFALLACFDATKRGLHSNWMIYTSLSGFVGMILIPLIKLGLLQHETMLFCSILVGSLKEGSYLIWISTWSQLMSRLFPKIMLGRIYSWSYFIGHVFLCISSQVFPRGLTYFMEQKWVGEVLGKFRFVVFFVLLGFPLLISVLLTHRIRNVIKERDKFTI
jgi:MFS family permease